MVDRMDFSSKDACQNILSVENMGIHMALTPNKAV